MSHCLEPRWWGSGKAVNSSRGGRVTTWNIDQAAPQLPLEKQRNWEENQRKYLINQWKLKKILSKSEKIRDSTVRTWIIDQAKYHRVFRQSWFLSMSIFIKIFKHIFHKLEHHHYHHYWPNCSVTASLVHKISALSKLSAWSSIMYVFTRKAIICRGSGKSNGVY